MITASTAGHRGGRGRGAGLPHEATVAPEQGPVTRRRWGTNSHIFNVYFDFYVFLYHT